MPEADATNSLSFLGTGQGFCGELAFLHLYQKALTSKERQTNYLAMRERINGIPKIAQPRNAKVFLDAHQYRNFGASTWFDMGVGINSGTGGVVTNTSQIGLSSTEWPKCYDFDGTDDRVTIGSSRMNVSTTAITISTWVRFDGIGDSWVVANLSIADYTKGYLLRIDSPSNTVGFYIGYGAGSHAVWSTNTISTGVWYNIVCTYKSGEQYLYVNGDVWGQSLSATGSIDYTGITTGYIGTASDLSRDFNGRMANLMIYDTVLSADEVNQNYNYFKNRFGK